MTNVYTRLIHLLLYSVTSRTVRDGRDQEIYSPNETRRKIRSVSLSYPFFVTARKYKVELVSSRSTHDRPSLLTVLTWVRTIRLDVFRCYGCSGRDQSRIFGQSDVRIFEKASSDERFRSMERSNHLWPSNLIPARQKFSYSNISRT